MQRATWPPLGTATSAAGGLGPVQAVWRAELCRARPLVPSIQSRGLSCHLGPGAELNAVSIAGPSKLPGCFSASFRASSFVQERHRPDTSAQCAAAADPPAPCQDGASLTPPQLQTLRHGQQSSAAPAEAKSGGRATAGDDASLTPPLGQTLRPSQLPTAAPAEPEKRRIRTRGDEDFQIEARPNACAETGGPAAGQSAAEPEGSGLGDGVAGNQAHHQSLEPGEAPGEAPHRLGGWVGREGVEKARQQKALHPGEPGPQSEEAVQSAARAPLVFQGGSPETQAQVPPRGSEAQGSTGKNRPGRRGQLQPSLACAGKDQSEQSLLSSIVRALTSLPEGRSVDDVMGSFSLTPINARLMAAVIKQVRRDWRVVGALYAWMKREGFQMSVHVYTMVLGAAGAARQWDHVEQILSDMEQAGAKKDAFVYNTLIVCNSNAGRYNDAMRWYKEMEASDTQANQVLLTSVIKMCTRAGLHDKAEEVSDSLRMRKDFNPDAMTLCTLIAAYSQAGNLAAALEVFETMRAKPAAHWDEVVWNSAVSAYARAGQGDGAERLVREMEEAWLGRRAMAPQAGPQGNGSATANSERGPVSLEGVRDVRNATDLADADVASAELALGAGNSRAPSVESLERKAPRRMLPAVPVGVGSRSSRGWGRFGPTSHAYNSLINAYAKTGDVARAEQTMLRMAQHGCQPTSVTYNTLLSLYAGVPTAMVPESVLKAEGLVLKLLQSKSSPDLDVYSFCTLIGLYSRADLPDKAAMTYERMLQSGIQPDLHVYSAMIAVYGRQGLQDEAIALYEELKGRGMKPDATILTSMLGVYQKKGCINEASAVAVEIQELGQGIDPVVSSAVISFFSKAGRLGDAVRVFEAARRDFASPKHRVPKDPSESRSKAEPIAEEPETTIHSNGSRSAASDTSSDDDAARGTDTEGSLGLVPRSADSAWALSPRGKRRGKSRAPVDAVLLSAMIDAYGKAGDLHSAERLFQELQGMERRGYKNIVAYTTMISLYGKFKRVEQAKELFFQLRLSGALLDVFVYNAMLDALAKGGEVLSAQRLFTDMLRSGPRPTVYTYSILINMHGREGNLVEASKLFGHMQQKGLRPNAVTYNSLLYIFAQAGMYNDATTLYNRMRSEGVIPNAATYNIMVTMHADAGNPWDAIRTFREMEKAGCEADGQLLTLVASMYGKIGKYSSLQELKQRIPMQTVGRVSLESDRDSENA